MRFYCIIIVFSSDVYFFSQTEEGLITKVLKYYLCFSCFSCPNLSLACPRVSYICMYKTFEASIRISIVSISNT